MIPESRKPPRPGSSGSVADDLLTWVCLRVDLAIDVSSALTGSLNLQRTVLRLLDLMTPRMADWAVLVLVDHTGVLTRHGGADPTFTATCSWRTSWTRAKPISADVWSAGRTASSSTSSKGVFDSHSTPPDRCCVPSSN